MAQTTAATPNISDASRRAKGIVSWWRSHWRAWWYRLLYWPTGFVAFLLWRYRSYGRHLVPHRGGLLVIANHQSFLDPPLVGLAVVRRLTYLARRTLFKHRWFAWLIDSLGAVPIDEEGRGAEGLKTALQLLQHGHAVVVFPEGSRTPDGQVHEFKPGLLLLLRRAQVPILPVGLAGAYQALPIHRSWPRFSPCFLPPNDNAIAVVVGRPISWAHVQRLPKEEMLAFLHRTVCELHQQAEKLRKKG
ncbi:MAG: 1-acyl-sn-glycerol-3-phosphate acyltransferase [Gemmataceae bacterium]